MVEYVEVEQEKPIKISNPKQRTSLIIFTYLINFSLYILLFDKYSNWFAKWLTFILIISFVASIISRQLGIGSMHGWCIVYAFINFFAFGIGSFIFTFNIMVIVINLLYLKYIVKRVNL